MMKPTEPYRRSLQKLIKIYINQSLDQNKQILAVLVSGRYLHVGTVDKFFAMMRNVSLLCIFGKALAIVAENRWGSLIDAVSASGNALIKIFNPEPAQDIPVDYKPITCMAQPENIDKEYFLKLDRTLSQIFGGKAVPLRCVPHRPGFMDYNISWFVSLMSREEQVNYYKAGKIALQEFDQDRLNNPSSRNVPVRVIYLHCLHLTLSKYLFPPHPLYQAIYTKVVSIPPLRLRGVIEQGYLSTTPGVWELALGITFAVEVLGWNDETVELLSVLFYQYVSLLGIGTSRDHRFDIEEDIRAPMFQIVSSLVPPQIPKLERLIQRLDKLKRRIVSEL